MDPSFQLHSDRADPEVQFLLSANLDEGETRFKTLTNEELKLRPNNRIRYNDNIAGHSLKKKNPKKVEKTRNGYGYADSNLGNGLSDSTFAGHTGKLHDRAQVKNIISSNSAQNQYFARSILKDFNRRTLHENFCLPQWYVMHMIKYVDRVIINDCNIHVTGNLDHKCRQYESDFLKVIPIEFINHLFQTCDTKRYAGQCVKMAFARNLCLRYPGNGQIPHWYKTDFCVKDSSQEIFRNLASDVINKRKMLFDTSRLIGYVGLEMYVGLNQLFSQVNQHCMKLHGYKITADKTDYGFKAMKDGHNEDINDDDENDDNRTLGHEDKIMHRCLMEQIALKKCGRNLSKKKVLKMDHLDGCARLLLIGENRNNEVNARTKRQSEQFADYDDFIADHKGGYSWKDWMQDIITGPYNDKIEAASDADDEFELLGRKIQEEKNQYKPNFNFKPRFKICN